MDSLTRFLKLSPLASCETHAPEGKHSKPPRRSILSGWQVPVSEVWPLTCFSDVMWKIQPQSEFSIVSLLASQKRKQVQKAERAHCLVISGQDGKTSCLTDGSPVGPRQLQVGGAQQTPSLRPASSSPWGHSPIALGSFLPHHVCWTSFPRKNPHPTAERLDQRPVVMVGAAPLPLTALLGFRG